MRSVRSVLGVVLLMWSGAGVAWAADPDDAWDEWRYDWYEEQQVTQAQAEGITGQGVPVAVIDQGIWSDLPELAGAHLTVREPSFCEEEALKSKGEEPHPAAQPVWGGTYQAVFIAGNGRGADGRESVRGIAPGADIRFYAVGGVVSGYYFRCTGNPEVTARAIVQAVDDGARIISLYDQGVRADRQIAQAVAYAVHEKVVVVVPSTSVTGGTWIQALNGVVSVGGFSKHGWWFGASPTTTVGAPGVGLLLPVAPGENLDHPNINNSLEVPAALVAGMLADVAQKWPEATNDQLIQTLIANAATQPPPPPGSETHWAYQPHGYGLANLPQMLAVDPTQYPDANPLIVPDDGRKHGLTDEDIRTAQRPAWAPLLPSAEPTPGPAPSSTDGLPRWMWPVLGAVVVAAAAIVLGARAWSGARRVRHGPTAAKAPTTEEE
ncbi:MAG: S8 family peptidase [Micrococcales bacterium]|nr:S8 family peptidase [Micrococcales bacterium]